MAQYSLSIVTKHQGLKWAML